MVLNVGEYSISLDCGEAEANVNFVSHAHSDHISGLRKGRKVIASRITKDLIECRNSKRQIELVEDPKSMKLLNAGHILGSKQLYAASDELGASIIYSGDYQMERSLVAEPIETMKADILIIDSTYPDKETDFGDRGETMTAMQHYIKAKLEKGIVLFGSYALGKAQEIIKIANEIGISPVVDQKISAVNQIYSNHGAKLDYVSAYKDELELESVIGKNFLGITTSYKLHEVAHRLSHAYGRKVYTAVATGFAKRFDMGVDVQFPLSDHADFRQALEYINSCNPKEIYTRGSRECSEAFARNLSGEGYNAKVFEGEIGIALSNKI
jgi:Cft2 family RNA processing exonuclease